MTASAILKQSDLKRMASVAKSQNVTVSIDIGGIIITVSPDIPAIPKPNSVDPDLSFGGNSLSEWRARHEGKSGGNSSRHKTAR